jgi:hypothetical protein
MAFDTQVASHDSLRPLWHSSVCLFLYVGFLISKMGPVLYDGHCIDGVRGMCMGKAIALDLVGAVQDGSLSVMIVSSSFIPYTMRPFIIW